MSKTNEKQFHSVYDDVFTAISFSVLEFHDNSNTDISETLIQG